MKIIVSLLVVFLFSCAEEKIRCIEGDCKNGTGVLEEKFDDGGFVLRRGEFKDGKMVKGREEYSDGTWLEGNFENSALYGKGKVFYHDSSLYEGDFLRGTRHGYGILKYKDGGIYEGDFTNDYLTGKGKKSYANGDVYEGDFQGGLQHGQGTYNWAKEKISYTGGWKNGKKDGKGNVTLANGDIQQGAWDADTLVTQIAYIVKEQPATAKTTKTTTTTTTGKSIVLEYDWKLTKVGYQKTDNRAEKGTIQINEKNNEIIIKSEENTFLRYAILDKMKDADGVYYFCSDNASAKYLMDYDPVMKSFDVITCDSKYDFRRDGPSSHYHFIGNTLYSLASKDYHNFMFDY